MGGGKATNVGVKFQINSTAYFLTAMLMDLPLNYLISEEDIPEEKINRVHSETKDAIDDIKLKTDNNTIYIQAKNNLKVGYTKKAPFYKAFEQFVRQNALKKNNEYYVIATSKGCSGTIENFKNIFNGIRKNPNNYKNNNNYNQTELDLINKLENMIQSIQANINSKTIGHILAKTYILIIDDSTRNNLYLLDVISNKTSINNANLLWNLLSQEALEIAAYGNTIDNNYIKSKYGQYISVSVQDEYYNHFKKYFNFDFCYDYFIVKDEAIDEYSIIGENRIPNKGINEKNGIKRFSTLQQAEEYCKNDSLINNYSIVDNTEALSEDSKEFLHYEILGEHYLLKFTSNDKSKFYECITCCKPVTSSNIPFVEKDFTYDINGDFTFKDYNIGPIHDTCIQKYDRYLGERVFSNIDEKIANISIDDWKKLQKKGQSFLNSIQNTLYRFSLSSENITIPWIPYEKPKEEELYAVVYTSSNESIYCETYRHKANQYTYEDAESYVKAFDDNSNERKLEDGSVVIKADVVLCTTKIIKSYNSVYESFYAPLIYFLDTNKDPFKIDGYILMLTDIFKYDEFMQNMKEEEREVTNYSLELITTDDDFDKLMLLESYHHSKEFKGFAIDPYIKNNTLNYSVSIVKTKDIIEEGKI